MANLHPKTLAALEAGPVKDETRGGLDGEHYIVKHGETPREFARRIALIAMEEEREAVANQLNAALGWPDGMAKPPMRWSDALRLVAEITRRGKP